MTEPIPIYITAAARSRAIQEIDGAAVLIVANDSPWNDFGYKFRGAARILGPHARRLDHLLMFEGARDTFSFLREQDMGTRPVPWQTFGNRFCSLFASEGAYETLVEVFGLDATIDLLDRLGDATLLRDRADDDRQELLSSEAFHLGMVREPQAYRAFRRGSSHLKARAAPRLADAALSFTATCSLPPTWREAEVSFDFSEDTFLRERIAVLVGPNGTGKSSLLIGIARALTDALATGEDASLDAPDPARLKPHPYVAGLIVLSSAPSDKYRQIAPSRHGPDYWAFTLIEPPEEMFDPLTLQLVDVLRDSDTLVAGQSHRTSLTRRDLLAEVLSELGIWEDVHLPVIEKYAEGLKTIHRDGVSYITLKQFRAERRGLQATRSADISRRPVHIGSFGKRDLSSGELAMFRFAVQLISTIEPGCLVILDEPETHLHPQFIARLVETLDRVMKATMSCAIIATHSPFIVREVPRDRVQVMRRQEGQGTLITRPRLQTFGASIDAIADAVFGDNQRDHLHEKLLETWVSQQAREGLTIDEVVERFAGELNAETLSFIARRLKGEEL